MADELDYVVGKGKPPKHTRFKKGQSGNPRGRRRGYKNVATLFTEVLNEKVAVTENGKRKIITKLEATIKQLVNKAASGDHRAMNLLLRLADSNLPQMDAEAEKKTQAELIEESARYLDLFYNGVRILVELGVPLPQIKPSEPSLINTFAVETVAHRIEDERSSNMDEPPPMPQPVRRD